jgi:hypothetical protein
MEESSILKLEDLIPVVRSHLVPHIGKAVEVCIHAYRADHYNDNYTFGTQLWRNIWNRISEMANSFDTPIEPHGKGNEYKFRIGPFILRHHRVGGEYLLPRSAKSAKYAAVQLNLFGPTFPEILPGDNIILAIEAEPDDGLKDVFIGELKQNSTTEKFYWEREIAVFTPEELSILKGKAAKRSLQGRPLPASGYQPNEAEPGEFVSLNPEGDIIPKLGDGKTDA